MTTYQLTANTLDMLKRGVHTDWALSATVCDTCGLVFLDGLEGNAADNDCDSCWDIKRHTKEGDK